jgi:O-antigen ligase
LHLPTFYQRNAKAIANNKSLVLAGVLLSMACVLVIKFLGFEKRVIGVLIGAPLLSIFLLNTNLIVIISILLLFLQFQVFTFKIAVFAPILIAFSHFLTYKSDDSGRKTSNPTAIPLLIYMCAMVPSFYNAHSYASGMYNSLQFASIIFMFFILGNYIKGYNQIKMYMVSFLVFSVLNGSILILQSFSTQERVFGFAGVYYVDLVCVSMLISIILAVYYRNSKSIPFFLLFIFLFTSLIITQTRNTILSFTLACSFLVLYLFINHDKFSINRKYIFLQVIALFIVLVTTLAAINLFSPSLFARLFQPHSAGTADSLVSNTLISRLLIWHTSLNAFLHHPIIGIGAYSFRFDSKYYCVLPKMFYKAFVQGLSPHITYLEVLTETGIIGFISFLVFLLSTIRMALRSVTLARTKIQKYFSLGILNVKIYILFSMCMTDAWLWGQCGMLWGVILGISLANYNIILRENAILGNK